MKKYVAEFIGTFVLVLAGCGAAVVAGGEIGYLGIAFAFGLAVLVMAYAIGPISGCHVNPAVTIGVLAVGKIDVKDAAWYIVAQCIGAIAGAGMLFVIMSGLPGYNIAVDGLAQNGFGASSPGGFSMISVLWAEIIFTAIFVLVILGSTAKDAYNKFAGIAIGFALVLVHLVLIPISNASVNPARSLGPAVFVGGEAMSQMWMFVVAPILGALLAALAWKALSNKESKK
ncbi:MAG: aquaporin Z [Patescibacteria group bacterium]|nr:aquaporin Z [Patescibacteria group bacterium]